MKRLLLIVFAVITAAQLSAQSLNLLNYSGKMYITKIEALSTPRYLSYEDHAILSSELTMPVREATTISFDFEKGIVGFNGTDLAISSKSLRKYTTDMGWNIVIYLTFEGENDRYEMVWQEYEEPYYQQITPSEDGVKICRMYLSTRQSPTSSDDALLMQLLGEY